MELFWIVGKLNTLENEKNMNSLPFNILVKQNIYPY